MAKRVDPKLAGRMANLERANEVRVKKARFKEDLARLDQAEACRLLADKMINEPLGRVASMSVQEVLLSVSGIGRSKAVMLARAADRTPLNVKVRDLPEHRRYELARVLRERANDVEVRGVSQAA